LKLVTVVVLDRLSKSIDYGFKSERAKFKVRVRASIMIVACGSEIMQECIWCLRI